MKLLLVCELFGSGTTAVAGPNSQERITNWGLVLTLTSEASM